MKSITMIAACGIVGFTCSIAAAEEESEHAAAGESHAFRPHHAALFAGAATNFDAEHTDPAVGVDYVYRLPFLDHMLGVGVFGEAVFASHTEYLVGIPVVIHPAGGLKLLAAPGMAFASHEDAEGHSETESHFLFRAGAGYDFHVGSASVGPVVNLDLIDGHAILVYGLSGGYGF